MSDAPRSFGIFDADHPPSPDVVSDCVHCGFCLPACPTYLLWGKEMDSPRGRIYLTKLGLDGAVPLSPAFGSHIDSCLGCMACVTACPSGVRYDQLIEAVRPQVERHTDRSMSDRLFRQLLFAVFPHPSRLRLAAMGLWVHQRLGGQALARGLGLVRLLPPRLRALESLAPSVTWRELAGSSLPGRVAAVGEPRRRVALLLGCVQRVFFDHVNLATARVLAAEGCEVIVPPDQGCCGALPVHAGFDEEARALARRTIDVFDRLDVDAIVVNAAGCGSTLKEYGHLLRDDARYAERAAALAGKCKDVSEILDALAPRAPRHPVPLRVAYHDACHLQHAQGVTAAPRRLLGGIPGLDLVEIPEAGVCCGSAGIYNLVEPEAAAALGRRKVDNLLKTGADLVVSGNPGCSLQLECHLRGRECQVRAAHIIEVIDRSIRGVAAMPTSSGHS